MNPFKLIIVVLLFLIVLSLSKALMSLFIDRHFPERKRVLFTLAIRLVLTIALLVTVFIGYYTGRLNSHAPWEVKPVNESTIKN
ncbi:DUF2909 domain-containing protein [Sessilibacter sp. MAH4]